MGSVPVRALRGSQRALVNGRIPRRLGCKGCKIRIAMTASGGAMRTQAKATDQEAMSLPFQSGGCQIRFAVLKE